MFHEGERDEATRNGGSQAPHGEREVWRGDQEPVHRHRALPKKPANWDRMTAAQQGGWLQWREYYEDMMEDEARDKMRKENGY
jgi:hypothetical protein